MTSAATNTDMTGAVEPRLRVPFVIAHAGEAALQPLVFVHRPSSGLRLSYADPRRGDEVRGVLRARVLNNRQGEERWKLLNTARQWRCMEKLLCQVCGQAAADPETGRIPWITTATAFREIPGVADSGLTSAPPTCAPCIPESLSSCPRLHVSSAVWTVATTTPAAVLTDMYSPDLNGKPVHTGERNFFVGLDEPDLLRYALATQLVVRLHDMQPAPHLAGTPQARGGTEGPPSRAAAPQLPASGGARQRPLAGQT
ncbi:hypothetical protein [Streptosporangium sp. NBC_01756]|uniref:hypothetical protein n=1 Tax=Streptosporangium sp. NBC_01756 TaxID=2975950 RepID=UPI002DDAB5A6|nr:hypothetical protein [Streptosporangium sp. NBC_01756]WSC86224.1 hypothetical protein OIE48_38700 [Streptosporangium sp. NBC_01756]